MAASFATIVDPRSRSPTFGQCDYEGPSVFLAVCEMVGAGSDISYIKAIARHESVRIRVEVGVVRVEVGLAPAVGLNVSVGE